VALVETGDNLGAMTSELKPSEYIEELVSGGPKNYAYKIVNSATNQRKTVCTVRGITLNYNASHLANFDVIRDMILKKQTEENVTVHTAKKIKRKRTGGVVSIITEPEDKLYRISFFKRRRLHDETSVPFGYK
jgi:cobalamin biosynthesis protein CbiD